MIKQILKNIIKFLIIHFYWNNDISLEKIFTDEFFFQNKIKKCHFFVFYHKKIFKQIINPIVYKYKGTQSKSYIYNYLTQKHEKQDDRTISCILRLLYELEIENQLVFFKMLELAQETSNIELKYWLIQSIETFAFWKVIPLPHDYYILRKKLIKEICNKMIKSIPICNENNENIYKKKKLCIISYLLGDSLKNSVQRVLQMITENIDLSFFDISIVCLDSFFCKKDNIINITSWGNSYKIRKNTMKMLNKDLHIYYCNSDNIAKKLNSSLEIIYTINPDLIIDISDEYSITSYIYSIDFPTLYIPLRGRVTSSYCTIYKSSLLNETIKQNHYYDNVLENTKIIEWSFPEYVMNSNTVYSRKQFNLPENAFILVSAGILPPDDTDFFMTMTNILRSNENFIWIIIGSTIPPSFKENASILFENKRIINWGFENNLDSLYRICNVFINPNKTGGSGTIAIAAQQKLPIVMSTFPNDAMRWVKEKNCISGGYANFLNEIEKLFNDRYYYKTKSELFYKLVNDANNAEAKWFVFNNILRDSIK